MYSKYCKGCGMWEHVSMFQKRKGTKDGYGAKCSDCYNVPKQRSEYKKNNKGAINASTRKRQAAKMQRTPKWLTESDHLRMKCIYQVADMRSKESDQKWHVDHIVPLQGRTVSGLHVPWNLRVIKAIENVSKGNRF